jgi:hypothetical protein
MDCTAALFCLPSWVLFASFGSLMDGGFVELHTTQRYQATITNEELMHTLVLMYTTLSFYYHCVHALIVHVVKEY